NDAGLVERRLHVGDTVMIHAIVRAERSAKGVADPVLAVFCLRIHSTLPLWLALGLSQARQVHSGPEGAPADAVFVPGLHRAARRRAVFRVAAAQFVVTAGEIIEHIRRDRTGLLALLLAPLPNFEGEILDHRRQREPGAGRSLALILHAFAPGRVVE